MKIRMTKRLPLLVLVVTALLGASSAGAQTASTPAQQQFLGLAANAVAGARHWWDPRYDWYVGELGAPGRYPQATIWDAVPLFESVDEVARADPSTSNIRAVETFANGAERYWDPSLPPHGGFAPYPGDRGRVLAYFDDNGWWGLAFLDAYAATGKGRYLAYAEKAMAFIRDAGWDSATGGLWWNTDHPYMAGESLGAGTWLAAALYRVTLIPRYLSWATMFQKWGQAHLWNSSQDMYARSNLDNTTMPYVEGAMDAADDALCEATAADYWCNSSDALVDNMLADFPALNMGPQYDAVYLRALLYDYADTEDPRLYALAAQYADEALQKSVGEDGLYLNAWDGGSMLLHDSGPDMLQTHAATTSLLAALAMNAAPSP
jgi:hypothetical protein